MSSFTVEVRSRTVGAPAGAPDMGVVALELLEERLTLAELIRRTVEEQVRELLVARKLKAEEARRVLDRQYLTAGEIARQAASGAVRYPSDRARESPSIDREAEVQKALRGFELGSFSVLVDGRRLERLEDVIPFAPGIQVTFLRLMPLVGG